MEEVLLEIRTEIEKQLSDNDWLEAHCHSPYGRYSDWYDGIEDGKDAILRIIDRHIKEHLSS